MFLFDEPLSNLDAALRVDTRIEIAKLHRELKATMIYVTHDQVEAMTLATKIVVINEGRIEQVGTPLDLYHHPANLFVAGFIGSPKMNFITGTIAAIGPEGLTVSAADGQVVLPMKTEGLKVGDAVTVGVRPEHTLEGEGEGLRLVGTVDAVEHLGKSSFVYLHLDDGTDIIVRSPGDSLAEPATRFTGTAPAVSIHLFDAAGKVIRRA